MLSVYGSVLHDKLLLLYTWCEFLLEVTGECKSLKQLFELEIIIHM